MEQPFITLKFHRDSIDYKPFVLPGDRMLQQLAIVQLSAITDGNSSWFWERSLVWGVENL